MKFVPGCKCCDCLWTFTVRGACTNAVQPGSIVDLYQSAVLIASGTTNGSGVVTLNVPAGTYDVVVTPPAGSGYAVNTSSRAHTCTQSTTITLAADSDHICWPCCGVPLPKTFHSTDSDGPIALTWDPTSGTTAPRYTLVTTTQVSSACVNDGFGCTDCQSPATVAKTYGLTFRTNCTVILGISTTFTCCTSGASFRIGGTTNEISTPFDGTLSCNPLMATFTIPTTFQVPSCLTPALSTPGGGGVLVFTP